MLGSAKCELPTPEVDYTKDFKRSVEMKKKAEKELSVKQKIKNWVIII